MSAIAVRATTYPTRGASGESCPLRPGAPFVARLERGVRRFRRTMHTGRVLKPARTGPAYTRRWFLSLVGWTWAMRTGLSWAGHPSAPSVVTISPDALKDLVDSQRAPVLLVDLRPAREYRRGRLPGAVSMSAEEVERRIGEVLSLTVVVLYCTCPLVDVTPLYERLRSRGHRNLLVLRDGFSGWEARGYPVEQ